MMTTTFFLAITTSLLFISCRQPNEKKTDVAIHNDTSKVAVDRIEKERLEKRKQNEEQEKLDSINDDKVLNEAIKIAEQHKAQNRFRNKYVSIIPGSQYQVEVDIQSEYYFSNHSPHLMIRRKTPGFVYIDIFSMNDKQFQKLLSHKQWSMEYTGDTIRDINGDRIKDFVVNWYGSTGCCLKAFSNVYIQRADKKSFSGSFEFINPTFSPKEQLIRGVEYGHPGETSMYKYKWNKESVDTVESVYYEKNDKGVKTGKIIVTNKLSYSKNQKSLKRLNYIPVEYRNIYGYNWFTGNLKIQ